MRKYYKKAKKVKRRSENKVVLLRPNLYVLDKKLINLIVVEEINSSLTRDVM